MYFDDLRSYTEELAKRGWLTKVDGADCELEIGTLTELMAEVAIDGKANGSAGTFFTEPHNKSVIRYAGSLKWLRNNSFFTLYPVPFTLCLRSPT